jgi:hypothetical protein
MDIGTNLKGTAAKTARKNCIKASMEISWFRFMPIGVLCCNCQCYQSLVDSKDCLAACSRKTGMQTVVTEVWIDLKLQNLAFGVLQFHVDELVLSTVK